MNEVVFGSGSVPVAVAAQVYGKDACWVRAGIITGYLNIGTATRNGKVITEGCDKSRDGLNLQILLINNICEAAVQHGYDELCDLSNSEGLIASLEDWIKINNLEDFCHVVYVDDPDCLCGIKIGRKENTSDGSNR